MRDLSILLGPILWALKNDIIRFHRSFYRKVFFYTASSVLFIFLFAKLLNIGMTRLQGLSSDVFNLLLMKGYSLIFIIIFFVQVINGFVVALNSFYQSKDLEVLFTSPVNRAALFFSRLIEIQLKASWMLVIFGIPLLVSSGLLFHAGFFYYVYALMLFFAFSSIPVNIGAGITIFLSGVFHARRLKRILLSTGIVAVVFLVTLLRIVRPERFVNPELFANLTLFVSEIKTPSFVLLPNRWLSESIFSFLSGAFGGITLVYVALLLLTPYITTLFLEFVFKRYHFKGWRLLQEGAIMIKGKGSREEPVRRGLTVSKFVDFPARMFDGMSKALIKKDFLSQIRDVRNIHQILIVFSLITIYLFSIASLPMNWVGYSTELRYLISFFNLGLILIITAALCARIVYPAVTEEGTSFWIIRTSPVTPGRYVRGKLLFFFVPLCIVGLLLAVFSSALIGLGAPMVALTVISTIIVSLSLASMAIAFGVSDLKYATGDRGRETKPGNTIQMIASISLILFTLVLEIVPVFLHFLRESKLGALSYGAWALVTGAAFFLCLTNFFVTFFSLRISVRKIEGLQM